MSEEEETDVTEGKAYKDTKRNLRRRKHSVKDMNAVVVSAIDAEAAKDNPDITGVLKAVTQDVLETLDKAKTKSRKTHDSHGEKCRSVLPPTDDKSEGVDTAQRKTAPDIREDREGDESDSDADTSDDGGPSDE